MDMGTKAIAAAALAVVLALLTWHFTYRASMEIQVRDLTISNAQLALDKVHLTFANSDLTDSLNEQSGKVREWEAKAKKRKEEADAALAAAVKEGERWRAKYKGLLSDPPSNPDNQAASLEERFVHYLEARADQ